MNMRARKPAVTRRSRSPPEPAAKTANDDDPIPSDPDEFRRALTRRMATFLGSWRECNQPLCKRARACRGSIVTCVRKGPASTPRAQVRAVANLYKLLKQRIDENERAASMMADA